MSNDTFFYIDEIVGELRKLLPDAEVYSNMIRYDGKHCVVFVVEMDGKTFANRHVVNKIDFQAYKKIPKHFYDNIIGCSYE